MTTQLFAAVDGGGSKTAIVIVDESGSEVARVETSTSNAAVIGHDEAAAVLRLGVTSAMNLAGGTEPLETAWFGLSGSDRPEDHQKLRPHLDNLARNVRMTNDAELVLAAHPGSVGVAAVSGTGSIALGRNAAGERARAGGWGHVFGDEGSGYDLARRMYDAFAREIDGRGPASALTPRLMRELELTVPFQLIAWVYAPERTKRDLAAMSRLVVEVAAEGDEVARDIIRKSARELANDIAAVGRRLGYTYEFPLAMTGGNLVHVPMFRQDVLDRLHSEWPSLEVIIVDDPALTAAQSLAFSHHHAETPA